MSPQEWYAYSRLPQHQRQLSRARQLIERALGTAESWYVSTSGGKDSTCVLALVRELAPHTPAQHSARYFVLPETRAYLDRIPNLRYIAYRGAANTDFGQSWESPEQAQSEYPGLRWLETREEIAVRGAPEAGVLLGLRADENSYRRLHLRTHGPLFRSQRTGKWQCNPIAEWSVRDVWACIHAHEIDYSRAYDVMTQIGVPLEQQRTGPFAVDRALPMGQLAILKRGWPEMFNRYAVIHPEARAYA